MTFENARTPEQETREREGGGGGGKQNKHRPINLPKVIMFATDYNYTTNPNNAQ